MLRCQAAQWPHRKAVRELRQNHESSCGKRSTHQALSVHVCMLAGLQLHWQVAARVPRNCVHVLRDGARPRQPAPLP